MAQAIDLLEFKLNRVKSGKNTGMLALYASVQQDIKGVCLEDLASKADCSVTTLRNWRDEKTIAPRINTLTKVAEALGYVIKWYKYSG